MRLHQQVPDTVTHLRHDSLELSIVGHAVIHIWGIMLHSLNLSKESRRESEEEESKERVSK